MRRRISRLKTFRLIPQIGEIAWQLATSNMRRRKENKPKTNKRAELRASFLVFPGKQRHPEAQLVAYSRNETFR